MKQHFHITDHTRYIFTEAALFLKALIDKLDLNINLICANIHISTKSFYPVIKGMDRKIGYYVTLLYYLVESIHGDDNDAKMREYSTFMGLVMEGVRRHFVVEW